MQSIIDTFGLPAVICIALLLVIVSAVIGIIVWYRSILAAIRDDDTK